MEKSEENTVIFNSLSCFDCELGNPCSHYFKGNLNYTKEDNVEKPIKLRANSKKNSIAKKSVVEKLKNSNATSKSNENSLDCDTLIKRKSGRKQRTLDYKKFFE